MADLRVVLNSGSSLAVDGRTAGHAHELKSKSKVLFWSEGRHKVMRRPSGVCPGPDPGGPPGFLVSGFLAPTDSLFLDFGAWLEWSSNVDLIDVAVPGRCVVSRRSIGVDSNYAVVCLCVSVCNVRGSSSGIF